MHNFVLKKFKQIEAFYLFFVFYFFVHNRLIILKKYLYILFKKTSILAKKIRSVEMIFEKLFNLFHLKKNC